MIISNPINADICEEANKDVTEKEIEQAIRVGNAGVLVGEGVARNAVSSNAIHDCGRNVVFMNRYDIMLKKPRPPTEPLPEQFSFSGLVSSSKIGAIYHVIAERPGWDYLGVLRGVFTTFGLYRLHMSFTVLAQREWEETIQSSFYIYSEDVDCIREFEEVQPTDLLCTCKNMMGVRKGYYKLLKQLNVDARDGIYVNRYNIAVGKVPPLPRSGDIESILPVEPGARYKIAVSKKNKPDVE